MSAGTASTDMERLARVLAGRSIGLALGGGGARGFAHIGLLRAIAEHGIPIDAIGGTSMGASVAAQFAMGRDCEVDLARWPARSSWRSSRTAATRCRSSRFVSAKRIELAGASRFGDVEIEDLWLPFFCVSSNLTNAQVMVHEQGTLWKATHASACLPGFGMPVLHENHLLVDGGLLNNLPTDIMREMGYGTVIASVVSVDSHRDLHRGARAHALGGVPRALRQRPPRRALSEPLRGRGRASLLHGAHVERANARHADVTVHPALQGFGLLQFERMDEIVEAGYQRAHDTLGRWRDFAGELFD